MIRKISKFFYNLPFVLAQLFRSRWVRLGYVRKAIFGYPVLLLFSGVLVDPVFALVVASVYFLGFLGLVFLISSWRYEGEMRWMYLGLGVVLLVLCIIWLEILYFFVPVGIMS